MPARRTSIPHQPSRIRGTTAQYFPGDEDSTTGGQSEIQGNFGWFFLWHAKKGCLLQDRPPPPTCLHNA
uniref:Uncharacterized protein n=1 Tax=Xanthomonas campestris pv. glycines TaxID=473421 RepID=Q8GLV4_XANCG|nr:unknown [Xanthomonas citri pv. glycines]